MSSNREAELFQGNGDVGQTESKPEQYMGEREGEGEREREGEGEGKRKGEEAGKGEGEEVQDAEPVQKGGRV